MTSSTMTQKQFLVAGLAAAHLGAKSTLSRKKEADLQAMWDAHLVEIGAVAAAADEAAPAAPQPVKAKRAKVGPVVVDGYTVQVGATCFVHDAEGKRVAVLRRSSVGALADAVVVKVNRVMTEYGLEGSDEELGSIGWIRNDVTVASVGRILRKALAAAAKIKP